jgi:hypothetical protein
MNLKSMLTALVLTMLLALAACGGGAVVGIGGGGVGSGNGSNGGGGGIGGTGSPAGTLSLSLTDAPSCGYDAVNLTIEKVRVQQNAAAGDADSGWSELVLNPPRRIDLLTLTNGTLASLGQVELPAGRYTQLRLILAANDAAHPLANSVVPSGGTETALTTPSAQQSGVKIDADIDVPAGQRVDVALDFDACKSIVKRGNSGQFNLKPVVSVIPITPGAGLRVVGYVAPSIALGSTLVSVQREGLPVKATPPDASGRFELYPVPPGTYDLVVSAAGHATALVTGVPADTSTPTIVNDAAAPIAPPAASTRIVSGTVTPTSATVRALQTYTGGPGVEAAWGLVETQSGGFTFTLPTGAPIRASWPGNSTALAFTADPAAASRFALQAESAGATESQTVDVSRPVPTLTFTFP